MKYMWLMGLALVSCAAIPVGEKETARVLGGDHALTVTTTTAPDGTVTRQTQWVGKQRRSLEDVVEGVASGVGAFFGFKTYEAGEVTKRVVSGHATQQAVAAGREQTKQVLGAQGVDSQAINAGAPLNPR